MIELVRERGEARAAKYTTACVGSFPPIQSIPGPAWLGTFSRTYVTPGIRLLDAKTAVDLWGFKQTPTEIARDYLYAKYGQAKRRHTTRQYEEINRRRIAPLLVAPGQYENMSYVDLHSAYWSIIEAVGWDVDYYPGKWLGKKSDNSDFPLPDNKVARASLVTAGLVKASTMWTGAALVSKRMHNPLANYDLWAVVQDTLAAVANIAISVGAVYIHTDGYIVPTQRADILIEEIEKFGLNGRVKYSGDATVRGIGSYTIGPKRTVLTHMSGPVNNVRPVDVAWLRYRLRRLRGVSPPHP